jgi:hypothetical protein
MKRKIRKDATGSAHHLWQHPWVIETEIEGAIYRRGASFDEASTAYILREGGFPALTRITNVREKKRYVVRQERRYYLQEIGAEVKLWPVGFSTPKLKQR